MLSNGKDERVVEGKALTLRLDNIYVVALGVWCWVARDEFIWRILASVDDWKSKGERMRDVLDAMHQAALASVYLQHARAFIAWEQALDGVTLDAAVPFRLG